MFVLADEIILVSFVVSYQKMAPKKEYHRKNYLYEAAHNADVSIPRRTLKRMQDADASASGSSGIELGKFQSF